MPSDIENAVAGAHARITALEGEIGALKALVESERAAFKKELKALHTDMVNGFGDIRRTTVSSRRY